MAISSSKRVIAIIGAGLAGGIAAVLLQAIAAGDIDASVITAADQFADRLGPPSDLYEFPAEAIEMHLTDPAVFTPLVDDRVTTLPWSWSTPRRRHHGARERRPHVKGTCMETFLTPSSW